MGDVTEKEWKQKRQEMDAEEGKNQRGSFLPNTPVEMKFERMNTHVHGRAQANVMFCR